MIRTLGKCLGSGVFMVLTSMAVAQSGYIANVPDITMPPTVPNNWPGGQGVNWCAPTAGANIALFWDGNGYAGAAGNPSLAGKQLAYEMGWFMDTNDWAVPDDKHAGTWSLDPMASGFDALNGLGNFARWDATHNTFGVNQLSPWAMPAGKVGYDWQTSLILANGYQNAKSEIDAGRPFLTSFQHWGVVPTGMNVGIGGNNYPVYDFDGNPGAVNGTDEYGNSWSQEFGLGHMVTTVGYSSNFNLNGQHVDLLVVHDGIPSVGGGFLTPVDLAIVYRANLWTGNIDCNPVPEPSVLLAAGVGAWVCARRRRRA